MINTKKFAGIARMGQKIAVTGRRKVSLLRNEETADSSVCTTSIADKGHFVAYTSDGARFVIPLAYISSSIFQLLFRMSEDEFGFSHGVPITLPCDVVSMKYAISLVRRSVSEDIQKAFVASIATDWCSRSSLQDEGPINHHILLVGF